MKALNFTRESTILQKPYDKNTIKSRTDEGTLLFCGDWDPVRQAPGIKYAMSLIDGIHYSFTLVDSTEDQLVFTVEQAAIYSDRYFEVIWSYLSERDFILADDDGVVDNAASYFGDMSHEKFKAWFSHDENKNCIAAVRDNRIIAQ